MKLIVGLGNPGKEYQKTRHNIGYRIVDFYSENNKLDFKLEKKFMGFICKTQDYIILKPTTFMNLSGQAVELVMSYYHIDVNDVLVISDDIDLPFSYIRLRSKGSAGGHNGLKSIISAVKTNEFKRLRFGIGRNDDVIDFVLGEFSKTENKELENHLIDTSNIIQEFIQGIDFDVIMNRYNKKSPHGEL